MLFFLALEELNEKDRAIVERLYIAYSSRVKALSLSILNDDSLAEDAVNDTFLKVIRYKEKFYNISEKEEIRLIVIIANSVCFNTYRRNKKIKITALDETFQHEEDDEGGLVDDTDVLQTIVQKETIQYLNDALSKLSSPANEMIVLKFYYDMKNTEIAEFFNMNVSTVGTMIQRSMSRLKKELEVYLNGKNKQY